MAAAIALCLLLTWDRSLAGSRGPLTLLVTSNLTIGDGDLTYEGYDVIVRGATLTVNGSHSFNSLTIERNQSNQAGVVTHTAAFSNGEIDGASLTIASDVEIEGPLGTLVGSRIEVSARGFPMVQGPGAGATAADGNGAGHGGTGGSEGSPGQPYGDLFLPTRLGSGGGNATATIGAGVGGAGGGCIQLEVGGALLLDGSIRADGANGTGDGGGGSGGSVRIVAGAISGSGEITANGGSSVSGGGGAGGRILIDAIMDGFNGTATAHGGAPNPNRGGAGTVVRVAAGRAPALSLDAGGVGLAAVTPVPPGLALRSIDVRGAARVRVPGSIDVLEPVVIDGATLEVSGVLHASTSLSIIGGGSVGHIAQQAGLVVICDGDLVVAQSSSITADGRGFAAGQGPGPGASGGDGAGGGHGGRGGGVAGGASAGGIAYGDMMSPTTSGSGGGTAGGASGAGLGGSGGGVIHLVVKGTAVIDGMISARGANGSADGGGGAGGSVWIEAPSIVGSGSVSANGGNSNNGGGGGGGRVSLGDATRFSGSVTAFGGAANANRGGAGTVILKSPRYENPDLIVRSASPTVAAATPLPPDTTVRMLSVGGGARPQIVGVLSVVEDAVVETAALTEVSGSLAVGGTLSVRSGAALSHLAGQAPLTLVVGHDLTVESGAAITVNGRGFPAASGPGAGATGSNGAGGGHGGKGGNSSGAGGAVYGLPTGPDTLGSGGGGATGVIGAGVGGPGGGAVRLSVGGALLLDGIVSADGGSGTGDGGGGAGGSIWIEAHSLSGTGQLRAAGANGSGSAGGGGGGRIAVCTGDGTLSRFSGSINVPGGIAGNSGQSGSAYLPALKLGDLDGDAVVGGADLSILLANWGVCEDVAGGCVGCEGADINANGIVDGADLALLLSAWGS